MPRPVIVQNSCYEVYKMVARRFENVDIWMGLLLMKIQTSQNIGILFLFWDPIVHVLVVWDKHEE